MAANENHNANAKGIGVGNDGGRNGPDDFARQAEEKQTGFLTEFWLFLRENKKWWLAPMITVLLLLGALIVLGSSSVAPFIYTLF